MAKDESSPEERAQARADAVAREREKVRSARDRTLLEATLEELGSGAPAKSRSKTKRTARLAHERAAQERRAREEEARAELAEREAPSSGQGADEPTLRHGLIGRVIRGVEVLAKVRAHRWTRPVGALVFLLAIPVVTLCLIRTLDVDTKSRCAASRDVTLRDLAWNDSTAVRSALQRWDTCDASEPGSDGITLRERGQDAAAKQLIPAAWLAASGFVASGVLRRRVRWRAAGAVGYLATTSFVAADALAVHWLRERLQEDAFHTGLSAVAGVALASAVGIGAVVLVAASLLAGGGPNVPNHLVQPGQRRGLIAFLGRWISRLRQSHEPAAPKPEVAGLPTSPVYGGTGISCSGGGIRSAAFALGGLQVLDEEPSVVRKARWLTAVSGGSYIATAWITARDARPEPRPGHRTTWSRRSPEEDHLRRHASYLAPGMVGKLWALTRFAAGFVVNIGLVAATLAVIGIPFGWIVSTGAEVEGIGGRITLSQGACIELPNGGGVIVTVPKEAVRIDGQRRPIVAEGALEPAAAPAASTPIPSDACAPAAATTTDDLPARIVGRRVAQGVGVPIAIRPTASAEGEPVEVRGRVVGCRHDLGDDVLAKDAVACAPSVAGYHDLPEGSRLVGAPVARFAVARAAVVEGSDDVPRIARGCGSSACTSWAIPTWLRYLMLAPVGVAAAFGIDLVTTHRNDDARRRREGWLRRSVLTALGGALVGWVLPATALWLVHWRGRLEDWLSLSGSDLAGAGTVTLFAALVSQLGAGTPKDGASGNKVATWTKGLLSRLRPVLLKAASYIVGPLLLVGMFLAFVVTGANANGFDQDELTVVIGLVWVLWLFGLGGDLNEWSLHPFYKEQLRSAFAVDPRAEGGTSESLPPPRSDPLGSINEAEGPDLVICAAANIADSRLTAPGRPVVSWTFSRNAIGSMAIASAAPTGTYAPEVLDPDLSSAWTAVAVSGAAFSPAMGKMGRPERMLFALGNLRLGVWYPNPRYYEEPRPTPWTRPDGTKEDPPPAFDESWYKLHHPRPWYLAKEALGLHRLRDPWVYVTDGGHYENLGLVELLRRECTEIYCFDAAGDSTDTFGTLSDAMRIARAELEVEIDIRPTPLRPEHATVGISALGVWPGVIRYPTGAVGWIVLSKLCVPRSAPFDIIDLARTLESFPTHPTADQLYTDQKFEAYRALGAHLGDQARQTGAAIRALIEDYGMSVDEAVAAVQRMLCALPDPSPTAEPTDA